MDGNDAPTPRQLHVDCLLSPALEAALAPDAVDDFDWEYVSPDGLHVREAFALATTWSTRLRRLVRVLGTSASSELVANQEWIEILSIDDRTDDEINDDEGVTNERVAIALMARANVLLWQALATCRGFTIKRNVEFWWRVFDHLHCAPLTNGGDAVDIHSVDVQLWHNVRLFDGLTFPRCRVQIPDTRQGGAAAGSILRAFAGLEPLESESPVMCELERALISLAPFVQVDRLEPVEIMIDFTRSYGLDEAGSMQLLDIIGAIENAHDAHAMRNGSTVMKHLIAQPWSVQLCISPCLYRLSDAVRDRGLPLHESALVPWDTVGRPDEHFETHVDRLQFMAYARWCLGISGGGGGVQRLDLSKFYEPENAMAGVCAGLPFTTSVTKVVLQRNHTGCANVIDTVDLAWLSFALFHPDSNTSTWRSLDIGITCRESKAWNTKDVMRTMAIGNNLRVVMGLTTETTDRYFTARLRAGTVIYATSKESKAVVMVVDDEDTEMDVCVTTTEVALLDEWVMVVVPGFGVGFVESCFIKSITARAPGPAFLTWYKHVVFVLDDHRRGVDFSTTLLELVGGNVEYLWSAVENHLDMINTACPKLVAYHLYASGLSEWTLPVSLRELRLTVFHWERGQLHEKLAMFQSLQHLETLVIDPGLTPFLKDIEGFVLPVLRSLRQLKRFYWRCGWRGATLWKSTYAQKRRISRLMIRGLVVGRDDVAIIPTSVAAIVALLSVVDRYARAAPASALGLIGRCAIMLIGSFLGTSVKRDLYIEAKRRWIHEERLPPPIVEPPARIPNVEEPGAWVDAWGLDY